MKEQVLICGEDITKRKALRYFWSGGTLSAFTLIYALMLYGMNVKDCRLRLAEGSCFPEWSYRFPEFLKLSMGANTVFPVLTLLLWGSVLFLLAGACLYSAFRNSSLTVSDHRIYGKAAFGTQVQIPLASILEVQPLSRHGIRLILASGSLIFGSFRNQKDICRILNENLVLRECRAKKQVQICAKGISSFRLAVLCFLPFVLIFLPLLGGTPSLAEAWESYWGNENYVQRFWFLEIWLALLMEAKGNWPSCLIYLAFPALLGGIVSCFACSRQQMIVTDGQVQGRGTFQRRFDFPLAEIRNVERGHFGTILLDYTRGKISIMGIQNREAVLQILEKSTHKNREEEQEAPTEKILQSQGVSNMLLGLVCFLPAAVFVLLLLSQLSLNHGDCLRIFRQSEFVQGAHFYVEYLLICTLSRGLGVWIKRFFAAALVGIYVFFAHRCQRLTLRSEKIQGNAAFGGYLHTDPDAVEGISMNVWGNLTLYTDSEKFVFGHLKNRKDFYRYFREKFEK